MFDLKSKMVFVYFSRVSRNLNAAELSLSSPVANGYKSGQR